MRKIDRDDGVRKAMKREEYGNCFPGGLWRQKSKVGSEITVPASVVPSSILGEAI